MHLPKTGYVVLTGDLAHFKDNWDNDRVPSMNTSADQTHASHAKVVKVLADKKAQLWINHDKPTSAGQKHSPHVLVTDAAFARTCRLRTFEPNRRHRRAPPAPSSEGPAGASLAPMTTYPVRLTSLAHGGGCGCKLAPPSCSSCWPTSRPPAPYEQLLVGTETADDAAVWQLDDETCVIATTDFFMPMVDDPYDFGRIAATNAISDVYAMGGKPIMALAILGMPVGKIPPEMVREILKGGAAVCADGRHPDRRRPFDRLPRADLRPGGDRHLPTRARSGATPTPGRATR